MFVRNWQKCQGEPVCVCVCVFVCVCVCVCDKKEQLCNVFLTGTFMLWLWDSLGLSRYDSESKKRYTLRLVSRVDYDFDQWSLVSFVIKKVYVYLFMVKLCIYLVIQMYFMQMCFHHSWSGNKLADFVVLLNFLLTLHATWTIKESKILRRLKKAKTWRQMA